MYSRRDKGSHAPLIRKDERRKGSRGCALSSRDIRYLVRGVLFVYAHIVHVMCIIHVYNDPHNAWFPWEYGQQGWVCIRKITLALLRCSLHLPPSLHYLLYRHLCENSSPVLLLRTLLLLLFSRSLIRLQFLLSVVNTNYSQTYYFLLWI